MLSVYLWIRDVYNAEHLALGAKGTEQCAYWTVLDVSVHWAGPLSLRLPGAAHCQR
jgi:hypothetical protein